MNEEELSWFLSFITLSSIAIVTTLYQHLISPIFEQTFHIFIFQVPAVISFACWIYIMVKRRRDRHVAQSNMR